MDAFCDYNLVGQCLSGQEEEEECDDVEDAKEEIRKFSSPSVNLTSHIMPNQSKDTGDDNEHHKWPDNTVNIRRKTANQFPKMPRILARPPPIRSAGTALTSNPCSSRTPPSCSRTPPLSPQSTWRCAAEPDMLGSRTKLGLLMTSLPGTGRVGRRPLSPPWFSSRG